MPRNRDFDMLKQWVNAWNLWRKQNPKVTADFSDADLVGAHLSGANLSNTYLMRADLRVANLSKAKLINAKLVDTCLSGADLSSANLIHANLTSANLREANLIHANLAHSNLSGADLSGADLSFANLHDAELINTNLSEAKLDCTDFSRASVGWTRFANNDLITVKGLDTAQHLGPSTIGFDTIYKSRGSIPEIFLRGAGVPENLITYMASLTGRAFEFYSCFISHSAKDKIFCERLYADLQAKGVRTWYFPEDATWGEPVWGEIDRSIKIYDKLVVVCSKRSLQSGPVMREIERALNREDREGKNVLFPIRIDSYIFDEWNHSRKDDVLGKVVGDFSGWNRNAVRYEATFKKLLTALRASG